MDWLKYDWKRSYLRTGPDQTYRFSTAIMSTCRKIYEESISLCRRENDFVCVTSTRPSCLVDILVGRGHERGLQIIAKDPEAYLVLNIAMTITLDPRDFGGRTYCLYGASEENQRSRYVFSRNELPTFCRLLLKLNKFTNGRLQDTAIHISVNGGIWNGHPAEMDCNPIGRSKIQELLDPLRQLHSFGTAQLEGPLCNSYKSSIITSLCRDYPTAMDIFQNAMLSVSQADQLVSRGRPTDAIREYKAALNCVRSCCWLHDEYGIATTMGPFSGLTAKQVMKNLKVMLQAQIASMYFNNGMSRMARIYIERALDPRRGYDYQRHWKLDTLELQPWQRAVYAEVLHVSAQINYSHGKVLEAISEVCEAGVYAPLNEDQRRRCEVWQKHADDLRDRHAKQAAMRELQYQRKKEKTQGICAILMI